MNYNYLYRRILDAYKRACVNSFPFSCEDLLYYCGYKTLPYSYLEFNNKPLYKMCTMYSDDAFKHGNIVYYNDYQPKGRIRFSLMHELGHIAFGHSGEYDWQEVEANTFASHILAPRMAIHYAKCENADDVHTHFKLTPEASRYAYDSYLLWYQNIKNHGNKISKIDKEFYDYFYSEKSKMFVWNIRRCNLCNKTIINNQECTCHEHSRFAFYGDAYSVPGFTAAEYNYLYGHNL